MIKIDKEICERCNTCAQHCVAGIIVEGPEIKEEIHKYCILCGHCAVVCPSGAITVIGFEDLEIPAYTKEPLISSPAMEILLRGRRSIRHFKTEPVSREHLEKIVKASSLVPTGGTLRAFKAYVCTDREVFSQLQNKVIEHFTRFAEVLKKPVKGMPDFRRERFLFAIDRLMLNPPEGRDFVFWNAPAIVVFTTTSPDPVSIGGAWIASFAAAMYAETIPVGTCYIGLIIDTLNSDPSMKPLLEIPGEELAVSSLILGYPDEEHYRYPPRRPMETVWV